MRRYPQFSHNLTATPEQKIAFLTDDDIKDAIASAKEKLGKTGRIVARPSGTEPLIRLMAEGEDEALISALLESTAEKVGERLRLYV